MFGASGSLIKSGLAVLNPSDTPADVFLQTMKAPGKSNDIFDGLSRGLVAAIRNDDVAIQNDDAAIRNDDAAIRNDDVAIRNDDAAMRKDNAAIRQDHSSILST